MKKKGAPKSMIRHEEEEMRGGKDKVKKFDRGGPSSREPVGPTSKRVGYFPNPFGKSFRFELGPTGGGYQRSYKYSAPFLMDKNFRTYPNPDYNPKYDPNVQRQERRQEASKQSQPKGQTPKATGLYDSFAGDMPSNEPGINMPEDQGEIKNRKGGKIHSRMKAHKAPKEHRYAGGGMTYSSGGSVYRKGADGIASRGKTKGHMVKMRYGGKC